jgi:GDP-4-dehydro-6-deoxy-D-mannose reductase
MRVLITGMNGFAGSHLADFLLTQPGIELFGTGLGNDGNITHLLKHVSYIQGNLTDLPFTESLLEQTKPDRIYHLAGQAFAPLSWQDPWTTIETNIRAEINLLHSSSQLRPTARILVIGSMDEYGRVEPHELPLTEETPFHPDSPYGVSKIAQDFLGLQYFLSHKLHVVRVRPSNHIGPRQSEQFVTSSFAKQIAEIEVGKQKPILYVGNLANKRDFSDVRDMVRAYFLALERCTPGEVYNIGSENAVSIQHILNLMLKKTHITIRVEQDPTRLRPSDTPIVYCSARKFRAATGWHATIPLEQSLHDILEYWRQRVSRSHLS